MATYGYLRLCLQAMPSVSAYWSPMVQSFAVISLVYASLATVRQSDAKALIAYSSIGHIAVVVLGVFSGTLYGLIGAVMLSLAHGVVSPALFVLTGGVLYDRYHSRSLYYYRGLQATMPIFSLTLLLALVANIGLPLTLNWLRRVPHTGRSLSSYRSTPAPGCMSWHCAISSLLDVALCPYGRRHLYPLPYSLYRHDPT